MRLLTLTGAARIKIWDSRDWKLLHEFDERGYVESLAVSPDGRQILASSRGYQLVTIRDTHDGAVLLETRVATKCVAFSPDGTHFMTGDYDGVMRKWHARTGALVGEFKGHLGDVTSVAFAPDGLRFVSGSDDGTVKLWDGRFGVPRLQFKAHSTRVTSAAFSPVAERLATGSADHSANLWDVRTGARLFELTGDQVVFNADGSRLASTSGVWDVRSGARLVELNRRRDPWILKPIVEFSSDGNHLNIIVGPNAEEWGARTGKFHAA
jgi:WD40 repeat protein